MISLLPIANVEAQTIGKVLGQGFADDPVNGWVFGDNNEKAIAAFYSRMAKSKYQSEGFGHLDEQNRGASLWLPPSANKEISPLASLVLGLSIVKTAGFTSLQNGIRYDLGMEKHIPKDPYYYLFAIATTPAGRGKGVGGQLMEAGLETVDAAKQAAFLESSKEVNVSFYRRFGFEVIEKVSPASGCPPLWLMWREPC